MTNLLDLSDEVLLEIISHLEPFRPTSLRGCPFYRWTGYCELLDRHASKPTRDLYSVSLVCRRLHQTAVGALYTYAPLLSSPSRSDMCIQTLEDNQYLSTYVKYVDIDVVQGQSRGSTDFWSLFWLPNVHTISIRKFDAWEGWEWDNLDHVGTSTVQVLRLIKCGAHEGPLTAVLSWPRALKELWYEASQGEWEGHYEGTEAAGFSCTAVERAMASQVGSLEKLVFTRLLPPHEGLGYSGALNLRRCEKLTSLAIYHVFLTGLEWEGARAWERLPRSIKELEVFYDDTPYVDFLRPEAPRPDWLLGMLDMMTPRGEGEHRKGDFTPLLDRVRVVALGWDPEFEDGDEEDTSSNAGETPSSPPIDELRGVGHPGSTWRPPQLLTESFVQAGVSFSIFLHGQRRYRYVAEGGRAFSGAWEDAALKFWCCDNGYWNDWSLGELQKQFGNIS